MLNPPKSAPDYESEMAKFKKDNGSWGHDHTQVDMMKSTLSQSAAAGPSVAAQTLSKK